MTCAFCLIYVHDVNWYKKNVWVYFNHLEGSKSIEQIFLMWKVLLKISIECSKHMSECSLVHTTLGQVLFQIRFLRNLCSSGVTHAVSPCKQNEHWTRTLRYNFHGVIVIVIIIDICHISVIVIVIEYTSCKINVIVIVFGVFSVIVIAIVID